MNDDIFLYDREEEIIDKVCELIGIPPEDRGRRRRWRKDELEILVTDYTSYDVEPDDVKRDLKWKVNMEMANVDSTRRPYASTVLAHISDMEPERRSNKKEKFIKRITGSRYADEREVVYSLAEGIGIEFDHDEPIRYVRRRVRSHFGVQRDPIDACQPMTYDDLETIVDDVPIETV